MGFLVVLSYSGYWLIKAWIKLFWLLCLSFSLKFFFVTLANIWLIVLLAVLASFQIIYCQALFLHQVVSVAAPAHFRPTVLAESQSKKAQHHHQQESWTSPVQCHLQTQHWITNHIPVFVASFWHFKNKVFLFSLIYYFFLTQLVVFPICYLLSFFSYLTNPNPGASINLV